MARYRIQKVLVLLVGIICLYIEGCLNRHNAEFCHECDEKCENSCKGSSRESIEHSKAWEFTGCYEACLMSCGFSEGNGVKAPYYECTNFKIFGRYWSWIW